MARNAFLALCLAGALSLALASHLRPQWVELQRAAERGELDGDEEQLDSVLAQNEDAFERDKEDQGLADVSREEQEENDSEEMMRGGMLRDEDDQENAFADRNLLGRDEEEEDAAGPEELDEAEWDASEATRMLDRMAGVENNDDWDDEVESMRGQEGLALENDSAERNSNHYTATDDKKHYTMFFRHCPPLMKTCDAKTRKLWWRYRLKYWRMRFSPVSIVRRWLQELTRGGKDKLHRLALEVGGGIYLRG